MTSIDLPDRPLHIRWLGRVAYDDALALQHGLWTSELDHLLLVEHPPVYTMGVRSDRANILVRPEELGADLVTADRGGDITFHGPGQLVGYPILTVPGKRGGGMADTVAYVAGVEQVLIDALADLGLSGAGRVPGYPGVWIDAGTDRARKIAAVGVRLSRNRSMHGFALNVDTDLAWFDHIVPCGIADRPVTSLREEGIVVLMREVVDAVAARAAVRWGGGEAERADAVWRHHDSDLAPFSRGAGPGDTPRPAGSSVRLRGRLAEAGVSGGLSINDRKPEWMRVKLDTGPNYLRLKKVVKDLDLVTVCEEAGCPNIFECWSDGTATFMINGERCTRACGFCLVETRKPEPLDPDEPARVAEAVERMALDYAVVTAVARDDLPDGGADAFVRVIHAIRCRTPGTRVEVLISDCKGDPAALQAIFDAAPDVLNHNIETVLRLQRAVRPSASYGRSLAVLARAKAAGLTTKSSIIVGMGETFDEVVSTLVDLSGIKVDIVTIGQYLRPTSTHLPIDRWWTPAEFEELAEVGRTLGIGHVESSPLTRSSYHAGQAHDRAGQKV